LSTRKAASQELQAYDDMKTASMDMTFEAIPLWTNISVMDLSQKLPRRFPSIGVSDER
jgi:hypothetical protein